ncbi:Hypothetical protein KFL_000160550 [Klebsormidium nitens]|uniref:Uncharacterized protein n=1 Tax=Klebsormidium nitens TaxID=105231 RepID=A0A1Y1HJE3_KLENI|nr:Hypothetical protein KFL_000160550 [Klebsormidium nitens]|eukprot:GAQ78654.1 Hypothetical protein KFL_000160550 [Klebsormidium nitens]
MPGQGLPPVNPFAFWTNLFQNAPQFPGFGGGFAQQAPQHQQAPHAQQHAQHAPFQQDLPQQAPPQDDAQQQANPMAAMFDVFTSTVRDLKSELSNIKEKIETSVHDAISGSFEHKKRKADKFKNEAAKKNYIPLEESHIRFSAIKEAVTEAKESGIGMAPEQVDKMDDILDEGLSILQDRMHFYEIAEAETWDVAKKMDEHDFLLDLPDDVKTKLKKAKKEVKSEVKDKSIKKKRNSFGFGQFRGRKGGFSKGFQGGFQQGGFQGRGFQQAGQGAELESLHRLADLTEAAEFEGFRSAKSAKPPSTSGQPSVPRLLPLLANPLLQD